MSEHKVNLTWSRGEVPFTYDEYNRNHEWRFENGTKVAASAAPDFLGDPACVDPEAAFVASLSSCHMLTFLAIAARKRLVIERYEDDAVGFLEKNADGKMAVTRVVLRPRVSFAGETPPPQELTRLHESSHRNCFIANSVVTKIAVEPG
jgi:organic hydroperoxide reductase OsmC/OhrA